MPRGLANRDRARFGGHYHDHADIGVDRGPVGIDRRDIDGVRLSRAGSFDLYWLTYPNSLESRERDGKEKRPRCWHLIVRREVGSVKRVEYALSNLEIPQTAE